MARADFLYWLEISLGPATIAGGNKPAVPPVRRKCQSRHVFHAGLPRTATTSVCDFGGLLGYKTYHVVDAPPQSTLACLNESRACGLVMNPKLNPMFTKDTTSPSFFCDVPFGGLACPLSAYFPDALFVLPVRNVTAWYRSARYWMCKWMGKMVCRRFENGQRRGTNHTPQSYDVAAAFYGEPLVRFCELWEQAWTVFLEASERSAREEARKELEAMNAANSNATKPSTHSNEPSHPAIDGKHQTNATHNSTHKSTQKETECQSFFSLCDDACGTSESDASAWEAAGLAQSMHALYWRHQQRVLSCIPRDNLLVVDLERPAEEIGASVYAALKCSGDRPEFPAHHLRQTPLNKSDLNYST